MVAPIVLTAERGKNGVWAAVRLAIKGKMESS